MKHLSKISTSVWVFFALVLTTTAISSYYITTKNIDLSIKTTIAISDNDVAVVIINSKDIYYIKNNSKIRVHFANKYITLTIKSIDKKDNGTFEAILYETVPELIAGTKIEATLIYYSTPLWKQIFFHGV